MKTSKTVSVLKYSDMRTFLKSYAEHRASTSSRWSYGVWAKALGLSQTASLTRIVTGSRSPGPSMRKRLSQYFAFDEHEQQHFDQLVELDRSALDAPLKEKLLAHLQHSSPRKSFSEIKAEVFDSIAHWHYAVLREAVRLRNFTENHEWLASILRLPVKAQEVQDTLAMLLKLGLLERDQASGGLRQADANIERPSDVASEAGKVNHEQNLRNARNLLRDVPIEEREYNGATLAIRLDKLPRAKEMIRAFKASFIEEMEAELGDGDAVYQIQVQLFPLTVPERPST